MGFPVYPALHVESGRLLDPPPGAEGGTGRVLTDLGRAYGEIYLIDVDGVRRNKADLAFLTQASRGRSLWVDAGSRFGTDVMDVLVAGAERVTIRWDTLWSGSELEELAELAHPETLYVGLEWDADGTFRENRTERGPADLVMRRVAEHNLGLVVTSPTFRRDIATRAATFQGEKWWLGPLTRNDVDALAELGYKGALAPAALAKEVAPDE